jgi:hypothetical protein
MAKGILKKIFKDHWESFKELYEYNKIRKIVDKEVKKMMNCGSFENGYIEYECKSCGEKKKVGFRCRSRFCSSCGKVYVDDRAENMAEKLIRTKHRHMVFTIPQELRIYFRKHRKLLSILPQCALEVIKSWYLERNKKEKFTPGMVGVIHTFGRDLKWNPHVHMLVPEGGAGEITPWKAFRFIPYEMLRKRWQKLLLDAVQEKIGKREMRTLKNKLYREKNQGFYVYGKGEVKSEKAAIQYMGRYTGRPVIAESRILDYDGEKVTFYYERHEDGKRVVETIDAHEFIKRVIVHIPERQFKMVRYYGIYAKRAKPRPLLIKMVDEKIKELRHKMRNWRMRILKSFGHDPIECKKCGNKMEMIDIYYPEYGSMLEIYRKRMEMRVEKEIEEVKQMYNVIKTVTNGKIEPVFR